MKEKASRPKRLCGSCVVMLGVLLGSLHMDLVVEMMSLSNFLMLGME